MLPRDRLGLAFEGIASALGDFSGAERRFQQHGEAAGVLVVLAGLTTDAYGLTPTWARLVPAGLAGVAAAVIVALSYAVPWAERQWEQRSEEAADVFVAAAGLGADLVAEFALIVYLLTTVPFAFTLTGGVANGLYTIAGIMLTVATPLDRLGRAWAAAMWGAGLVLSAAAFAGAHLVTAAATAVLFALFCPWCVYLGVRLR